MNISGLGSTSWYTSLRSTTTTTRSSAESTASATDSASISAEGFAALMQQQGGKGPPAITDEAAGKIGASIAEKNQALFSALDADGNGTLSATELKAGMETMHQALGAAGRGGPPPMTDELAAKIGAKIKEEDADLFTALDADSDGTLTAAEMEAGKESGVLPPPPPPPASASGDSTDSASDQLSQLLQSTGSDSLAEFQANLMNDILKTMFASSASAV